MTALDLDAIRARVERDRYQWHGTEYGDRAALLAEVDRLNTVIGQVRELHRAVDSYYVQDRQECEECEVRYPCPTILALGGVS